MTRSLTTDERRALSALSARPDVQQRARRVAGLRPIWPGAGEVPVRIVVTPPVNGGDQRESRIYPGGELDRTSPRLDATSRAAPGPALNIYPRAQRSLIGRVLRRIGGR